MKKRKLDMNRCIHVVTPEGIATFRPISKPELMKSMDGLLAGKSRVSIARKLLERQLVWPAQIAWFDRRPRLAMQCFERLIDGAGTIFSVTDTPWVSNGRRKKPMSKRNKKAPTVAKP